MEVRFNIGGFFRGKIKYWRLIWMLDLILEACMEVRLNIGGLYGCQI